MFEELRKYKQILVTGPQRSGTRITAKAMAHDTGHSYIDERVIDIDSLYRLTDALQLQNVVVQAPALCRFCHEFSTGSLLVVMCMRDIDDIIASQERIGWHWEPLEMLYYPEDERLSTIAETKYEYWRKYQRDALPNTLEVHYEDLSEHPLWVPKEKRANFGRHQTELANA